MPAYWRAAAAGLDLLTAVCAALNLAYFSHRVMVHPPETASRRAAALALAVVSLATLVESLALLATASSHPAGPVAGWAFVRGLSFAGALGISVLVLRRLLR